MEEKKQENSSMDMMEMLKMVDEEKKPKPEAKPLRTGPLTPKDKLIVALDILDEAKCFDMVDTLSPVVDIFKVGSAVFSSFGEKLIEKLNAKGKKIFLDLKFHDIPNTARSAVIGAVRKKVFMLTIHSLGGRKMMTEAVAAAKEEAAKLGVTPPLVIAVTVLTSMDMKDLAEVGIGGGMGNSVKRQVLKLAGMARVGGCSGIVTSTDDAKDLKRHFGRDLLVVVPGIRPTWAQDKNDQKQVLTPKEAIQGEADFIVVGRPIIENHNPLEAASKILEEIK